MKLNKKLILAIVLAVLSAFGVSVSIDDKSPFNVLFQDAPAQVQNVSTPSNFAGSLSDEEDAGVE